MARYVTETFPVGSFQCNCTLVIDSESRRAIVVDPGDELDLILERVDAQGLEVRALWHTHAHIDHIGATYALYHELSARAEKEGATPPKVYLHAGDKWLYDNVAVQASMLGMRPFKVTETFESINDGQKYEFFDGIRAIHTPGHTPGSCCLSISALAEIEVPRAFAQGLDGEAARVLLSGDTLFRRSIGRTDLWGGDGELILKSIRKRLLTLPPDTIVIPGHGPLTSVEEELAKNPYTRA